MFLDTMMFSYRGWGGAERIQPANSSFKVSLSESAEDSGSQVRGLLDSGKATDEEITEVVAASLRNLRAACREDVFSYSSRPDEGR